MQAGWGIELFVRGAESEFQNEVPGSGVCGVMSGEERFCTQVREGEFDDGAAGFFREALAPIAWQKVDAQFEDALFDQIGPEAGATGVLLRFEQENRPVLDVVFRG